MNAGRVRYREPSPGPADDWDRGLVPNETTVIEPAVDSGREPAGRVTHVGVQLPDEAAEVVVREMHREDLPGELLHIVDGERLAILGPGDDVLEARILHDSVPASRARSGRVSAREVGRDDAMAFGGFGRFFLPRMPNDGTHTLRGNSGPSNHELRASPSDAIDPRGPNARSDRAGRNRRSHARGRPDSARRDTLESNAFFHVSF